MSDLRDAEDAAVSAPLVITVAKQMRVGMVKFGGAEFATPCDADLGSPVNPAARTEKVAVAAASCLAGARHG